MSIGFLIAKVNDLKKATADFSEDVEGMSEQRLTDLPYITDEMAAALPIMLKIFHEKHAPEIRRAIAYISNLHERQKEAWSNTVRKWNEQTEILQKAIDAKTIEERRRLTKIYIDGSK